MGKETLGVTLLAKEKGIIPVLRTVTFREVTMWWRVPSLLQLREMPNTDKY